MVLQKEFDVVVVGAGTAGCLCARDLAREGVSVAVIEEDSEPGKQGRCTAIFSKQGLDCLQVDYYKTALLNQVRAARVHAKKNQFSVRIPDTVAVVLDRFKFDKQCAKEAIDAGAKIFYNSKATLLQKAGKNFMTTVANPRTKKTTTIFESKFLVGADGLASVVASQLAFPDIPPKDFILCREAEYSPAFVKNPDTVDLYLDVELFRGFFGWIVPTSRNSLRLGFGVQNHALLDWTRTKFIQTNKDVEYSLAHGRAIKKREYVALIPLRVRKKTQRGNAILIGDAAGQVKATTGGGVVIGGLCARLAARRIKHSIHTGEELDYEKQWRKKYSNTLRLHRFIRNFLNVLDDATLDFLFGVAVFLGLPRFLEQHGDMDFVIR